MIMTNEWRALAKPGETLVDLERDGLYLLQGPAVFPCGQDSVLLSDFARLKPADTALDMGCGTGVLAILCHAKTGAAFTLLDSSPEAVDTATRNMAGNRLDFPVHALCWQDAAAALGCGKFSAVLCNPPYFAANAPERGAQPAARCEETGSLFSAAAAAFLLLNNGGRLYCCYPADRLTDALTALRGSRLEPKRLRLVAAKRGGSPYLALIEAKKGGRPGLAISYECGEES